MRILQTFVVLAAAAVLAAGQAYAINIDREYLETFDAAPGMRLHLEHGDGDVVITPWSQDKVEIHVRYLGKVKKVGLGKVDTDFRAEFDVDGNTIFAKGYEPGGTIVFGFLSESSVEYQWTIKAPAYLELEILGDDGDAQVSDWKAMISVHIEDGDCTFNDIAADIRVDLDDGDFTLDGLDGRLDLDTEDGDVVLRNIRTEDVLIKTDDGDVLIDDAVGYFEIESEDGDIDLDQVEIKGLAVDTDDGRVLATEISGDAPEIDIRTADGDVHLSFMAGTSYAFVIRHNDSRVLIDAGTIENLREDDRRVSGTVGAGRGQVRIHTDDGRVTLEGGNKSNP